MFPTRPELAANPVFGLPMQLALDQVQQVIERMDNATVGEPLMARRVAIAAEALGIVRQTLSLVAKDVDQWLANEQRREIGPRRAAAAAARG